MDNLWVIFLTGLTIGGITCMAVQGGLLASIITKREEESAKGIASHAMFSTVIFLVSKFFSYVILGFVLGSFGGMINIGGNVQTIMQFIAGFYMVAVALNLLNIHPIFRYVVIQPPRFLTKLVRNQARSKDIFAPALLGAMTIFIPCGTTLAMEALAISSANAFTAASIMAAFILGTMPLFLGIGFITSLLGEAFKVKFLKIAAIAVFYLGLTSINGSLVALGSPITFETITENFPVTVDFNGENAKSNQNLATTQNAEIVITNGGYQPNYIRVKKDLPVTLTLISQNAFSCALAFRIPSLNITKNLKPNDSQVITFTPTQTGKIPYSCSMGMYRGIIEVI